MPSLLSMYLAVMLAALIAYGVFGGADFGGGIWDLFAFGPRKQQQRAAIAKAMGPVWEANHVWLIFVVVLFFTGFPRAFALYVTALFIPLHWLLVGIVVRGVAFVFRSYASRPNARTDTTSYRWGILFGIASALTPVLLGISLSAFSSGHLRTRAGLTDPSQVLNSLFWLSPLSLAMGAAALSLCAYLAAVFLTLETKEELQEDFRIRALISCLIVVFGAACTLPMLRSQTPHLWSGLIRKEALPILIVGTLAACAAAYTLWVRYYRIARMAAVLQVVCVIAGWGVAQYPYLIYPDMPWIQVTAPNETLKFVLFTLPFGLLVLIPSLWFLFRVFKSNSESI